MKNYLYTVKSNRENIKYLWKNYKEKNGELWKSHKNFWVNLMKESIEKIQIFVLWIFDNISKNIDLFPPMC